jgi:uncharacterized protein
MTDSISSPATPRYWNQYLAGTALGTLLFLSFLITGNGLGASGGLQRITSFFSALVSEAHVNAHPYVAAMAGTGKKPLEHWLVFEVVGVLIGGFLSGLVHRRVRVETFRGPRVTDRTRWALALLGGFIMGYGARLARGCTSGHALSGGAVLSAGAWAFMFAVFGGGYLAAWFLRKQWL